MALEGPGRLGLIPHFIEHVLERRVKTLIRMGQKMPRSVPIKEGYQRQVGRKLVGPGGPQGFCAGGCVDWTGVSNNRGWVGFLYIARGTAPQVVLASNNRRLQLMEMWYASVMTANRSCPSLDMETES